eukprot:GHVP01051169.1.p1 GENE.GHVP01051169.1~~GHVP01051169.1.p1  ORF type:complete len:330 (-),score=56.73 GHVP01051169.1:49-1038(-)
MEKKWGDRYATSNSVHLKTKLLPLMEKAFEKQSFGCFDTFPTLNFRVEDNKRLHLFGKKNKSDSRFCESQMQDPEVQLESFSVEKLKKDQYAFILVPHTNGRGSNYDPIVVPLPKKKHLPLTQFAEKFWLKMNPSKSFSPKDKKIVKMLLSFEKEQLTNNGFVVEMPDDLLPLIGILKCQLLDEKKHKTIRKGVYSLMKYNLLFTGGSHISCSKAKVIGTSALSILSLTCHGCKRFIFAVPKGKNPEFDEFVKAYGIFLQSEDEMEKFLDSEKSESSDSVISSMDDDSDGESDISILQKHTISEIQYNISIYQNIKISKYLNIYISIYL